MGFFDILGNLDNLASLYKFIEDKRTTDEAQFERQITKIVRVVYEDVLGDLKANSGEYREILPPDGEDLLAQQVIYCLRENHPFTQADVLLGCEGIPAPMRKRLFEVLLKALHSSLEFAVRDYIAWSQQKYGEIDAMLRGIDGKLDNITGEIFRDSAQDNHSPRKSASRFHYSEKWTELYGRDGELAQLEAFCTEKKPFSWWVVTGEGGSGKTRLAYDLAERMAAQNWTICAPPNHTAEILYRCSESLRRNTLFLLDYSEYDTATIGEWMQSLRISKYSGFSIRVLLVQRVGKKLEDFWPDERSGMESFLKETAYGKGESLALHPIDEEYLYQIIESFASHRKEISHDDAKIIYEHLARVDGQLLRPLFAMILTDAYLDSPDAMRQWEREDVLDHIYKKEVDAIESSILRYCEESQGTREGKTLCRIGLLIQMMATMTGGFTIEKDKPLLAEDFAEYEQLPRYTRNKFLRVPALFGGEESDMHFCPPLEPDIIGEHFVIKQWEDWGGAEYINATWAKPQDMSKFLGRLFQDFSDKLAKWKDYLVNVVIPDGVTSIGDYTFAQCYSLASITIPDSVTSIGWGAFILCKSLGSIVIPDSVHSISNMTFAFCELLDNITIPDSVTSIGENAFRLCNSLTNIIIPDSVTSIGEGAFWECDSLQFASIPDTLKYYKNSFPSHTKITIRKTGKEPLPV